jgi:hypothetical protein
LRNALDIWIALRCYVALSHLEYAVPCEAYVVTEEYKAEKETSATYG